MEESISAFSLPPLVEGVGNEVLIAVSFIAVVLPYLCYLLFRHSALPAFRGDPQNPTPDQLREQFLAGKYT